MIQMDCTVIVPVFGRPIRTLRLLASLVAQRTNKKYQVLLIGDGCPVFQEMMEHGVFTPFGQALTNKGCDFAVINLQHCGGYGYNCRNVGRTLADGEYVIFVDNDDIVAPNHIEQYCSRTKEFVLGFGVFPTWIVPTKTLRLPKMEQGYVGHSELCIKKELLLSVPLQTGEYGHDWELAKSLAEHSGGKYHIFEQVQPTYSVMSLPDNTEQGID